MIKRPLVWILCAYVVGMYLAWQGFAIEVTIIFIIFLIVISYLFVFKFRKKIFCHHDKFLWFLPLLFILGYCSMKGQLTEPKLYEVFDQEISCEINGEISMIVRKQWGRALYLKDNTVTLSGGDQYICENIIVFCYDNQSNLQDQDETLIRNYLVGNQISVKGTIQKFSEATNPGQFNEKLYYQIENIDFKMIAEHIVLTDAVYSQFHVCLDKIKGKLLEVYSSILNEKEAGTLIAMLLGEKYLLEEEIKQLYQINGISHILAISGLHVSLIGLFIFHLLRKLKLPIALATIISIFFFYSYGVLTNFSVSTNRAVVMMVVMLFSALLGKTYDMLSALALSAFIILLQNPLQILSAGFLLSFGAVLGIAVLFPCLKKLFSSKNQIINSLHISISTQVTTTPFVMYFYYQFPVYSILTNLIILPFVTVLTLTSIFAGIAGAIYLPLGIFVIGGANYILKFYEWVCRIGNLLPGNLLTVGRPGLLKLLIYMMLCILFIMVVKKSEKKVSVLILAAALLLLILPERNVGLEITMLDVGQGEAIYMESGSGTTYLIDGGSADVKKVGINRIQPFLLSKGTDCIDYAIITHSDSDHISGLLEIMVSGKIKINNLVLPDISDKDEAYMELETLAKGNNITVRYISTGDAIKDGKLQILCLHPVQEYDAFNSNSYSTVLSISYGEFDMLLTGDLQQDGEEMVTNLLENPKLWEEYDSGKILHMKPTVDYDILKVAHHGSKYSTLEDFLELIKPEYSLISCGKDNFYGHPHKELLERLEHTGSEMKITYETGAIRIRTDGKRMEVDEFLKK